ncbi:hypothetical protein M3Y97_00957300 [Aphelenchoides bicaudatus]|nr:hypothetical protein M3Y97_00957300 [Aphelenchoides bicaudatus]
MHFFHYRPRLSIQHFMYIQLLLILSSMLTAQLHALYCFDSESESGPGAVVNCSENELCYSEFYSVSANSKSRRVSEWHVDRFCVHKEQCLRRGIGAGRCVDLSRLDPIVQSTFRAKVNQKHNSNTHRRLLQSEFCCCQRDFCNKLDVDLLKTRYNISSTNESPKLNVYEFMLFIVLWRFMII